MDFYQFYTGREFHAYQFLGAHLTPDGAVFRTFAPAALRISVIGEFNGWEETPMRRIYDGNFWECRIPGAAAGMMYKYRIYRQDGRFIDHADPYAFYAELRPQSASILYPLDTDAFHDRQWMKNRRPTPDKPINIYELHCGSWKKPASAAGDDPRSQWYNYRELAGLLLPYVKEQGYNYIELMPLQEYPSDASWGYQATGFFSPTSRYGTPDDLRALVDQCHANGIGVILDFVAVHFAVNDYALWNYDGTALYEYPHADVGYSEWGSCNFMHSRGEVCSFLQSAACYWLQEFHFDGLRMDAVGNLIYWQGDSRRGENLPALRFLQTMNAGLKSLFPDALLIAEDSTARPGTTAPVSAGGLGFDYKWDLGFMNDTLSYFRLSPQERKQQSHKLTFSMHYFYQERYLLPFSHDEVVHGKATILQKMYGDYDIKFPQARALYLYLYTHPGCKLNFMGNEFGQLREWDENREQDWEILRYPLHDGFRAFLQRLHHLYLTHPALSQWDYSPSGFRWLQESAPERCLFAFERACASERLIVLFNFSDTAQPFLLAAPSQRHYQLLADSDENCYGGTRCCLPEDRSFVTEQLHLTLAPFSGCCYAVSDVSDAGSSS